MKNPSATLTLQYPIEWHNDTVSTVEFRRIKLKDMKNLPKEDAANIAMLLSRISDYPPAFYEELDALDLDGAKGIIQGFLSKSQETGEKSSDGSPTE